jgi:hypothetical protein
MIPIHKSISPFLLLILFFIAATVMAQVPSYSPDDVPPGVGAYRVTYTGSYYLSKPNHQVAFVMTGLNEQKVWFSIDTAMHADASHPQPSPGNFYNRRYRASSSSPWYWQYAQSQPVYGTLGFVDTVLYSATPKYQSPNGQTWSHIMYTVNQPHECNGTEFGYAMVQFSNDGVNWYHAQPLRRPGGPSSVCAPWLGTDLFPVEALDAIDDLNGTIWMIGMGGTASVLSVPSNMDQTFASWGYSQYGTTSTITIAPATEMVSNSGVFSPSLPNADPTRFKTYSYFFNMAMVWDSIPGDLYWTRGYPYPFDRNAGTPSLVPSASVLPATQLFNPYFGVYETVEGCAGSPAIYPNRYQIYKMHLGSLSNFAAVHTGTWTLVADRGYSSGYLTDVITPNTPAPLVAGQTAGSRDASAASFLRNSQGWISYLVPRTVFGATTFMSQMSGGPCRVTGLEGITAESIP